MHPHRTHRATPIDGNPSVLLAHVQNGQPFLVPQLPVFGAIPPPFTLQISIEPPDRVMVSLPFLYLESRGKASGS